MNSFRKKIKLFHQSLFNDEGFSLLEILVASAIATIMLVMINTSYLSIVKAITVSTGFAEFYENVNLAVVKIDRDFSNAYFKRKNKKASFIGDVESTSSIVNFVSINRKPFNIVGNINNQNPTTDVHEVGYYLKEDPEHADIYFLIRREENLYDEEPLTGGNEDIILENVVSLKFEYKLRNNWTERWDSRNNKRFPKAVKTTITLKNYSNVEEKFIFLSYLNMRK